MAKVLGVRGAGPSVLQTSERLRFSHTTILRVYREFTELEWADWLDTIDRQQKLK